MWPQVLSGRWGHSRLQILTAGKGSSRVTCEPRCSVWSGVHLETGHIIPGATHQNMTMLETMDVWKQSRDWQEALHWTLWTSDHRNRVWNVGSTGNRTCDPNYRVWKGGQPGDCGPVATGPVSGKWHHTGDCGLVTLGTGFWGWGNSGLSGHVTPQ